MTIDQRVQSLEQEVQLLKAQIRTTLLDIQEQLLNNAYPSLRMDEAAQQPARVQDDAPSAAPSRPAIFRPMPQQAPPAFSMPPVPPSRPLVGPNDWAALGEMARWVNQKVNEVGAERTQTIIQMYALQQRRAPETIEAVQQFVASIEPIDPEATLPELKYMDTDEDASYYGETEILQPASVASRYRVNRVPTTGNNRSY